MQEEGFKGEHSVIDTQEHVYHDDPASGHPDVRTRLKDVSYFFIGNGLIQAAIQHAPSGEGTPLGLLIMNPEILTSKRHALTMDPEKGLEPTLLKIRNVINNVEFHFDRLTVDWSQSSDFPTVEARWSDRDISVCECFYCPNRSKAQLVREVTIRNDSDSELEVELLTTIPSGGLARKFSIPAHSSVVRFLQYSFNRNAVLLELSEQVSLPESMEAQRYWESTAGLSFTSPLLDHLFKSASAQLPAVISRTGKVDASMWQYNREWVRDHSFMALGLTLSGHHELAGIVLQRLLDDFISNDGAPIDSSEIRNYDEVELDQNGILLYALEKHVLWSGDLDIALRNWDKIIKTAEFPLQDVFRHAPSGMFYNRREFWERHAAHGITPGIELTYQAFPVIGLNSALSLAAMTGNNDKIRYWKEEASKLKRAILKRSRFAMHDQRGFIKRRSLNGTIIESIQPQDNLELPDGVPLAADEIHYLNPDSASAMLIAYGFIPPDSDLAIRTMRQLENLWNQRWNGGGYSRYNITSEPDSEGAWSFVSVYMARAYGEMGDFDKVWRVLRWLESLPGYSAGSWFEMYGQRIAPPYPQVGITPWTWSEMLMLFVENLLGIIPDKNGICFRTRVIPGLDRIQGSLPFRGHRINLDVKLEPDSDNRYFLVNGEKVEAEHGGIFIDYQEQDIAIEACS